MKDPVSISRPVDFVDNAGEDYEDLAFDLLGNDLDLPSKF